ncbi:hypothetical protein H5410_047730 [Solanum commersonii]|uniref:Uncharacterized protein n=1 Tax=Solanum commersonii TaxID=4109 RepID=A0A9J5XJX4_SOLCO|nr:hypothetical protein H5410_047730 [Solanum commersonii]
MQLKFLIFGINWRLNSKRRGKPLSPFAVQNTGFRNRLLNDWEVERVAALLGRIGTFTGTTNEPDTIRWEHNTDGQFTVNRVY